MKKYTLVAPLVSMALLLAGCTSVTNVTPPADTTPTPPTQTQTPPAGMSMEPQTPPALTAEQTAQLEAGKTAHTPTTLTFNMTSGMFYFVPNVIQVKKGDTVKIIYTNAGGFHDFVLDEFNVKMAPNKTGETATVEFVADKVGTFEYYCSVGQHRKMGQKGTLIVE